MMRCEAVYDGPSAAKGGQCLLEVGHTGDHETYGIMIGVGNGEKFTIISDGSQHWHFSDNEKLKAANA